MKNKNTPEIHFAGFNDEWEEKKLGEMGTSYTGLSGKTKKNFGHGEAKYITYMNVFSNPLADFNMTKKIEFDSKQNTVNHGDIFFTISSETPEEVGMSCVWLYDEPNIYLNSFCFGFRPKQKNNYLYFAYVLRSPQMRKKIVFLAQGISRYNISKIKMLELNIPIPSLDEQSKIGNFFKTLDDAIATYSSELEALKQAKQGFLQKMFPREGQTVPEIRFPGFSGEWEEKKLGELFNERNERSAIGKLLSITISLGIMKASNLNKRDSSSDNKSNYKIVEIGDIAYNSMRMWQGASGLSKYSGIVSPAYTVIKPKKNIASNFFSFQFKLPTMIQIFQANSQGLTSDTWNLKYPMLKKIKVKVPSFEEQNKIGNFFTELDDGLKLKEKELELLKQTKTAFLQKMFV